jgi:antitoxin MazE
MRKHLSTVGSSLGLVIEKPILELLNITKDIELEVVTDGERIIVARQVKPPEFLGVDDVLARVPEATDALYAAMIDIAARRLDKVGLAALLRRLSLG